jgi:hypothetical protein
VDLFLVFVGEIKKNVTRQTWRAPIHFDEYLFQSTCHFGECLKKMVSHTEVATIFSQIFKKKLFINFEALIKRKWKQLLFSF